MRIAESAVAAARQHHALADRAEVGKQRLAVLLVNLRARRHREHDVVTVCSVAVLAHAGAAVLGLEMLLVAVVDEGVEPIDRLHDHVTASAAVAAVGPAELDELLAPERHAAVAAVAGADMNLGLVEEFHGACNMRTRAPNGEGAVMGRSGEESQLGKACDGRGQGGPCLTDAAQ